MDAAHAIQGIQLQGILQAEKEGFGEDVDDEGDEEEGDDFDDATGDDDEW